MKGLLSFIVILLIMPIGHAFMVLTERYAPAYLVPTAVALSVAGIALVALTRWIASEGWQTLVGLLAGTLLWTGAVEYGFLFAAERFHVQPVGTTGGEYMLLEYTAGLLLGLVVYLLYQESVRCSLVLWLRRKLHLMRGPTAAGPVYNYGPRAAFEMFSVLWFFYVVLLVAYDIGVTSWVTYLVFIVSFGGGLYALYRLYQQKTWGMAIRYAAPTVVLLWNNVEILAKWRVFTEPWIAINVPFMASVVIAFLFLAYLLVDHLRQERQRTAHPISTESR